MVRLIIVNNLTIQLLMDS